METTNNQKAGIKKILYADDDRYAVLTLTLMRIPSLVAGLALGIGLSFITSRFEEVLAQNIAVVFFIPFIVYMAAAVGAQTQSIYIRDLKSGKARFKNYLIKETAIGLILGILFGFIAWAITSAWLGFSLISHAVGISLTAAIAVAPLVSLIVTEILWVEHQDPAVGVGPIATVIQDAISIAIYGFVSSAIILA